MAKKYVSDPGIASSPQHLISCKLLVKILHHLKKQFTGIVVENKTDKDKVNEIVEQLQDLSENEINLIRSRIATFSLL